MNIMQVCKTNKYEMLAEKKGKLNTSSPFKSDNGYHLMSLLHGRGNPYSS
jgi:hypothetical protein